MMHAVFLSSAVLSHWLAPRHTRCVCRSVILGGHLRGGVTSLHPQICMVRLCQMPNTAHRHKDFTSSRYRFPIQKSRSEPWCSASPSLRCCDSGAQPRLRASFIFFVIFFSLPPLVSLCRVVDRGGAERAVKGASGEGSHQGFREGPGAGRPVVGGLPGVLSTKV